MAEEEQKPINWGDFKVQKPGETARSKIIAVEQGKVDDFFGEKYFEKVKGDVDELKKSPAIRVETENGAKLDMILPKQKIISPGSTLGKFIKLYGYPVANNEVSTIVDENGFNRIVI